MKTGILLCMLVFFAVTLGGTSFSEESSPEKTLLPGDIIERLSSLSRKQISPEVPEERSFPPLFIYFSNNSTEIRSQYIEILQDAASILRVYPDLKLHIRGHAETKETKGASYRLARERAEKVLAFFIHNHPIARERMTVLGFGDEKDFKDGNSGRRVELVFLE